MKSRPEEVRGKPGVGQSAVAALCERRRAWRIPVAVRRHKLELTPCRKATNLKFQL